jgi:hypothetical protein
MSLKIEYWICKHSLVSRIKGYIRSKWSLATPWNILYNVDAKEADCDKLKGINARLEMTCKADG